MNPIYLSTGTFTGRVNGRNLRLLAEHWREFACDGFELLLFEDIYERLPEALPLYRDIPIPVVHSDKTIGDLLSAPEDEAYAAAEHLLRTNLDVCEAVGAAKMVLHGWGRPDRDREHDLICERILRLWEIARLRGVDLLPENCCCEYRDPLAMFDSLLRLEPRMHFIFDTRLAQFHRQIPEMLRAESFQRHAVHMHINDFAGNYKEWDALGRTPPFGTGDIDWESLFEGLRELPYRGSVTLEAPAMLAQGVDTETLNRRLSFIRSRL